MRGLFVEAGRVRLVDDLPAPELAPGETRVRVLRVGVCATDLALVRGHMEFSGVPGHEFVGVALDGPLAGQRVVGEINAACGRCTACTAEIDAGRLDGRHCPERTVLGILGRPGAFAEELRLPTRNLHPVPDACPTDRAVFCEPLAAAYALLEAVHRDDGSRALVAGDGRLGLLCAHVLLEAGFEVTLAGRHPERAAWLAHPVEHVTGWLEADGDVPERAFDVVVEASGDPAVLARALTAVRPRGTLVLKTTGEAAAALDASRLVVDEVRLVGSRCGRFEVALVDLTQGRAPTTPMISARYALRDAERALVHAAQPGTCKVLIDMESEA